MEIITGTGNLQAGPASIAPARPPQTYLGVARSMMQGVKVLASTTPPPALPHALLSAHVLECLLKAALSKNGSDKNVRGHDVRHNLEKLWSMAAKDGLNISASAPDWVTCLGALHDAPYRLRYSAGVHGIVTPPTELMTSELEALIAVVENHLK